MGVLYLASVGRRQGPVVLMRCDKGKPEERTMNLVFLSDALGPERFDVVMCTNHLCQIYYWHLQHAVAVYIPAHEYSLLYNVCRIE